MRLPHGCSRLARTASRRSISRRQRLSSTQTELRESRGRGERPSGGTIENGPITDAGLSKSEAYRYEELTGSRLMTPLIFNCRITMGGPDGTLPNATYCPRLSHVTPCVTRSAGSALPPPVSDDLVPHPAALKLREKRMRGWLSPRPGNRIHYLPQQSHGPGHVWVYIRAHRHHDCDIATCRENCTWVTATRNCTLFTDT